MFQTAMDLRAKLIKIIGLYRGGLFQNQIVCVARGLANMHRKNRALLFEPIIFHVFLFSELRRLWYLAC